MQALTEKVVLVTSVLLWEMPPLRLPGRPPPCGFFWLLTMVSMEWLRTRMALCGDDRGWGPESRSKTPPSSPPSQGALQRQSSARVHVGVNTHAHTLFPSAAPTLIPGACRGFLPALGMGGSLQAEVREGTGRGRLGSQCPRSPAKWTKFVTGRKVAGTAHQPVWPWSSYLSKL